MATLQYTYNCIAGKMHLVLYTQLKGAGSRKGCCQLPLILCFAVVSTPLGHAQEGLNEKRLRQEPGAG